MFVDSSESNSKESWFEISVSLITNLLWLMPQFVSPMISIAIDYLFGEVLFIPILNWNHCSLGTRNVISPEFSHSISKFFEGSSA